MKLEIDAGFEPVEVTPRGLEAAARLLGWQAGEPVLRFARRWRHPQHCRQGPELLIPVTEKIGDFRARADDVISDMASVHVLRKLTVLLLVRDLTVLASGQGDGDG